MPLSRLIEDTIPLNRKERYYTGTVLPMIMCRENFKHFDRFLRILPGKEVPTPASGWSLENILFFTEYSINESLIRRQHRDRFASLPKNKDTPDVLIFISEPEPVLIAIEAKGKEILASYEAAPEQPLFIGRKDGLSGKKLASDIESGRWRTRKYETSTVDPGNDNWFSAVDFMEKLNTK